MQTNLKISITGNSQAIASSTEIIGHTRDESNFSSEARNLICLASIVSMSLNGMYVRILGSNNFKHFLKRNHLPFTPFVAAKWHVFNESYFEIFVSSHFHKGYDLSLIKTTHHNAVYLELNGSSCLLHFQDAVNTFHYSIESVSSGHDLELERIKSVKA